MKQRCNNTNSKDARNYSKRGICVCDEWNDSFESFRDWALSNGYNDSLTLDRVDVNDGYSPDNCRWATAKEQARNTRYNHLLEFNGVTKSIADWAEEYGMKYCTLHRRIMKGWPVQKALTTPVKHIKKEGISSGT